MARPLEFCKIALSGKFDQTHGKNPWGASHFEILRRVNKSGILTPCEAKIGALIRQNGGKHCTRVMTDNGDLLITHLIATAEHVKAKAIKVQEASQWEGDVHIINFDWLTASLKRGDRSYVHSAVILSCLVANLGHILTFHAPFGGFSLVVYQILGRNVKYTRQCLLPNTFH